jgi:hypothetical protein
MKVNLNDVWMVSYLAALNGPLRPSAISALKHTFNAEIAEGR